MRWHMKEQFDTAGRGTAFFERAADSYFAVAA